MFTIDIYLPQSEVLGYMIGLILLGAVVRGIVRLVSLGIAGG